MSERFKMPEYEMPRWKKALITVLTLAFVWGGMVALGVVLDRLTSR